MQKSKFSKLKVIEQSKSHCAENFALSKKMRIFEKTVQILLHSSVNAWKTQQEMSIRGVQGLTS